LNPKDGSVRIEKIEEEKENGKDAKSIENKQNS
jgi:hypothetical protein